MEKIGTRAISNSDFTACIDAVTCDINKNKINRYCHGRSYCHGSRTNTFAATMKCYINLEIVKCERKFI